MKIFLSYSTRDILIVQNFRDLLQPPLSIYLAEENLPWGERVQDRLRTIIRSEADFVIFFVSNEALNSTWVRKELEWAVEQERDLNRIFLLPVLLPDTRDSGLPAVISEKKFLHLSSTDKKSIEELAGNVKDSLFKLVLEDYDALCAIPRQTTAGENSGTFALCIPRGEAEFDEFSTELDRHLRERLGEDGIGLVDCCPSIDRARADGSLWNFRKKIRHVASLRRCPAYLLIIWPGLRADDDQNYVLTRLRTLTRKGCRIAFINEFPDIDDADPDFRGKVFFIRVDVQSAVEWLCDYITTRFGKSSYVLLVHASQEFQVARERKNLYEETLQAKNVGFESCEIQSWDANDAKSAVLTELEKLDRGKKTPCYDVIAAANDDMAIGAAEALAEYSKRKNVTLDTKVVGYDGLRTAIELIKSDEHPLVATVAANPRSYADYALSALCENLTYGDGGRISIPLDHFDLKTEERLKREW